MTANIRRYGRRAQRWTLAVVGAALLASAGGCGLYKEGRAWLYGLEAYIYGFPHEMRHFVDCILNDRPPRESGEDGRATLEIIYAAYESAANGRRISWPYSPARPQQVPVQSWLEARSGAQS